MELESRSCSVKEETCHFYGNCYFSYYSIFSDIYPLNALQEIIMSKWNRHVVLPRSKRVDDSQTTKVQEKRDPAEDVKNGSEFQLTAITLVITVTFAVSLQVPGGYDTTGKPVLRENISFQRFLYYDSQAFGCSVALMFIHLCILAVQGGASPFLIEYAKCSTRPMLGLSVCLMIFAFNSGLQSVLDETSKPRPLDALILLLCPSFSVIFV